MQINHLVGWFIGWWCEPQFQWFFGRAVAFYCFVGKRQLCVALVFAGCGRDYLSRALLCECHCRRMRKREWLHKYIPWPIAVCSAYRKGARMVAAFHVHACTHTYTQLLMIVSVTNGVARIARTSSLSSSSFQIRTPSHILMLRWCWGLLRRRGGNHVAHIARMWFTLTWRFNKLSLSLFLSLWLYIS